jgi:hypothetical protein
MRMRVKGDRMLHAVIFGRIFSHEKTQNLENYFSTTNPH